jgi:SulP family sulfate permease
VVVAPVSCLPAVVVGLLLNVLDALSYGKSETCAFLTRV